MTTDREFMRLALEEARRGVAKGQSPFGCVVIREGRVVGRGHNTVHAQRITTRHAEINAIERTEHHLERPFLTDCTLYTVAEPCVMCFGAIHWARIPRIVYGISISEVAHYGFNELKIPAHLLKNFGRSSIKITEDVLADEICELFNNWKANPNSRPY